MIKSEERKTEYCVIVQPRHREQSPYCFMGYAKNAEEAASTVLNSEWHKEVLDVKVSNEIEWNLATAKKYWEIYGEPKELFETEAILF